jgi:DNA polymerase elongation subunit (family B)
MTKQFIKTHYVPASGRTPDYLYLYYRQNGEKHLEIIETPMLDFYISTKDTWVDDGLIRLQHRPVEELTPYSCPYRETIYHVATLTGRQAEVELMGSHARQIHFTNNVCGSDFDIEDHYIDRFLSENNWESINPLTLKLAFFDIEVDTEGYVGFPSEFEAPCPINVITYHRNWSSELFVFVNIEGNVPMGAAVGSTRKEALINSLQTRFSELVNRPIRVEVKVFTNESDLLLAWIDMVVRDNPDFIGAWNARFDILTIENRMRKLSLEPGMLFGVHWWHKIDMNANSMEERVDIFMTATPYTFIDLLTLFCQVRKGFKKEDSYALDYISSKYTGVYKEDMRTYGPNVNITTFCRLVPEGFLTYSALDTFLLDMINNTLKDIDFVYRLSLITRTRINAVFFKTIMLRNFAKVIYRDKFKRILCNNHNALNESAKGLRKFRGGFVADPNKNLPYGIDLGGNHKSSYIFDHVVDMDFSSMYPSMMRALNIAPETLVGFIDQDTTQLDPAYIMQVVASRDIIGIVSLLGYNVDVYQDLQKVIDYGLETSRLLDG